jgi:predicted  nucleic acid-binding Zn-ribbon protein
MSMKRSQRGAARVSITWLVVFLVLTLVACAFGYLGYEEAEKGKVKAAEAEARAAEATTRDAKSLELYTRLSEILGYYPEDASVAASNLEQAKIGLDAVRSVFPDLGPDVKTVEVMLRKTADAYLQQKREIAGLNQALADAKSEKTTMESGLRDALRQKDSEISDLRKQLTDEQNTAANRQNELEARVAALNTQRSELDAELRQARNTIEATVRKHTEEMQAAQTRMASIMETVAFTKEPEAEDGRVVSVSEMGLGWIDIGANNRLARGTRFRVVSGAHNGKSRTKGWAEVTQVKPTMAEVRFYDITDRFDPIVRDDVVFNPVYDPKGERTAVLAGRFSGQFNETELKTLLANMGIKVQDKLAHDTDYLIVGAELYVDENGQTLENPLPPQELAVYKSAESQGTNIVSIKQLRDYFKF